MIVMLLDNKDRKIMERNNGMGMKGRIGNEKE